MERYASALFAAVAALGTAAHGQLVLFPNSTQTVIDNQVGDTNNTVGTISVANWAVPDANGNATAIEMTGDVIANYVGPTNVQAGSASVTITNTVITNTNATSRNLVGSTPFDATDYPSMLEFVFFTHPTLAGSGSVNTTIDGNLGQLVGNNLTLPASNTTTDQQLRLGGSHTQFASTTSDFATAHWFRPGGTLTAPVPMNASGSIAGNYATGTGTLQIHIDDALVLGASDTMAFPTSITVDATGSVIPEPATVALLTIAGLTLLRRRAHG